jgi:hypothetical protein
VTAMVVVGNGPGNPPHRSGSAGAPGATPSVPRPGAPAHDLAIARPSADAWHEASSEVTLAG